MDIKENVKILIKQFLGQLHSWSACGWGIASGIIDHEVNLFATDGIEHLPIDLKDKLIGYTLLNQGKVEGKFPGNDYDLQISYTCMKNFPMYLTHGKKKIGIWCYEWAGKNSLPTGFAKNHKYCDYLLPPTNFAKQVFLDSGVPEDKMRVISHGIGSEYLGESKIEGLSNKKFKILANIAQNHLRKNIPGLLEAYGQAFDKKDDVCLIIKGKDRPVVAPFEISLKECLNNFRNKYKNAGEIKILSEFLPDISELYRSIDATFTMSNCEGYYLPALENLVSGKLNIAPRWGGQLDLLNNENSLLITGKEERADLKSMYWESKNAIWFKPDIKDAVEKLRFAYQNFEEINKKLWKDRENIYNKYSWNNISKQILELV